MCLSVGMALAITARGTLDTAVQNFKYMYSVLYGKISDMVYFSEYGQEKGSEI